MFPIESLDELTLEGLRNLQFLVKQEIERREEVEYECDVKYGLYGDKE